MELELELLRVRVSVSYEPAGLTVSLDRNCCTEIPQIALAWSP